MPALFNIGDNVKITIQGLDPLTGSISEVQGVTDDGLIVPPTHFGATSWQYIIDDYAYAEHLLSIE